MIPNQYGISTHPTNNGRVLYQALADFRERFGSDKFQADEGYTGRTTSPASILGPMGPVGPVDRDWGASHEFDPPSRGGIACWRECVPDVLGGCTWYKRVEQTLEIAEPGLPRTDSAGGMPAHLYVSFSSIHLPTMATLIVSSFDPDRARWVAVVETRGPLDYETSEDGALYSAAVQGGQIQVVARRWLPDVSPCTEEALFELDGWRHVGGLIPDRLLVKALWRTNAYEDWYDLMAHVFSADRELYGSGETGHQGLYYRDAFSNHGIDKTLNDVCDRCNCVCHVNYWCTPFYFMGECPDVW